MNVLVPDQEMTRDNDLASWQSFGAAYYEPILRALKILRVPDGEVEELAHGFLVRSAERRFLDTFKVFQDKEAAEGRHARFRTYLYRSLQNYVCDHHRKKSVDPRQFLDASMAESCAAGRDPSLDPDALYALGVLHQALQALRRHCERTGKPHLWVFFEETLLASEFRGRKGKTRAELLAAFPGADAQFLDNSLTTAKRAFRRFIQDVIPRGMYEREAPSDRFAEWMAILRESNASQFNLLHVAFRVIPSYAADLSQASSAALVVNDLPAALCYEEPSLVAGDDEMSVLLSFRLELPLTQMLDAAEVQSFIPPTSRLWPFQRERGASTAGGRATQRPGRSICLLTLIEPTSLESEELARADVLGLLRRLKSLAKQMRRRPDHTVPEVFAQLLYTIVSVLAMVHCRTRLYSIRPELLADNVRWFLRQSWLDDRIRPLFLTGLKVLASGELAGPAHARSKDGRPDKGGAAE